jgi:hypothetical protein
LFINYRQFGKFVLCIFQADRFKVHDSIKERKLLWHGTNVAVVAAILKSGLRIMPHSGGRVGKGIYFASENDKSAGYGELLLLNFIHHPTQQPHRFYILFDNLNVLPVHIPGFSFGSALRHFAKKKN